MDATHCSERRVARRKEQPYISKKNGFGENSFSFIVCLSIKLYFICEVLPVDPLLPALASMKTPAKVIARPVKSVVCLTGWEISTLGRWVGSVNHPLFLHAKEKSLLTHIRFKELNKRIYPGPGEKSWLFFPFCQGDTCLSRWYLFQAATHWHDLYNSLSHHLSFSWVYRDFWMKKPPWPGRAILPTSICYALH